MTNDIIFESPFSEQADTLARSFEAAREAHDNCRIEQLIHDAEEALSTESAASQASIYYSLANMFPIYAKLHQIETDITTATALKYYRMSIECIERDELSADKYSPFIQPFRAMLFVNYANMLCECGRYISAIQYYKKALHIRPDFGMALGNLGRTYTFYACADYDDGHRDYILHTAYTLLNKAVICSDPNTHEQAKAAFSSIIQRFSPEYIDGFLEKELPIPHFHYDNPDERLYRRWVVSNGLFLNTLNDLPLDDMFIASDVIHLPDMVAELNAKPVYHGMYNQFKQEYIFCRYQYYSAQSEYDEVHWADKETHLINSADYPMYGIRIEQLKSTYKTLYGLFDKIAYFLNHYFDLGIHEHDISFCNIWRSEIVQGKHRYALRNRLDYSNNFPLASLYWISRELFTDNRISPSPYLERLRDVRHALEHRYVKVIVGLFPDRIDSKEIDDLAVYVTEDELLKLTKQLLHIVREALICLSLCVHSEEQKRSEQKGTTEVFHVSLGDYDDSWKL